MPDATLSAGIVTGALVYGALYVAGLFVAGLWFHIRPVVVGAILTAGFTYLSFIIQIMDGPWWLGILTIWSSIILGIATGIVLLFYLWN